MGWEMVLVPCDLVSKGNENTPSSVSVRGGNLELPAQCPTCNGMFKTGAADLAI